MSDMQTHPFKPIVFNDTHTLILGSFPSLKSFENNFYYAHPRNQFWKILEAISGYPVNNRDQKIWLLKETGLGLWDVVGRCRRENSADSSLSDTEPNDIEGLLARYPAIRRVAFTGKKAQSLFEKHFGFLEIERIYLPSPSPAYAAMKMDEKIRIYGEKLGIRN